MGKDFPIFFILRPGSISNPVMIEWTQQEQMGRSSKALGLRIIRILEETFLINENEVFHGFGVPVTHPLAVPPCLRRSACPPQGFWRWGFAQADLNLSHLAHLLLGSGIPMAICHEKRDAYLRPCCS
jgi:hypothetical protein